MKFWPLHRDSLISGFFFLCNNGDAVGTKVSVWPSRGVPLCDTYVDEEDEHLVEVCKVGPRFNEEAKLLLKVTTKADLLRRKRRERKEEGGKRWVGGGGGEIEREKDGKDDRRKRKEARKEAHLFT